MKRTTGKKMCIAGLTILLVLGWAIMIDFLANVVSVHMRLGMLCVIPIFVAGMIEMMKVEKKKEGSK